MKIDFVQRAVCFKCLVKLKNFTPKIFKYLKSTNYFTFFFSLSYNSLSVIVSDSGKVPSDKFPSPWVNVCWLTVISRPVILISVKKQNLNFDLREYQLRWVTLLIRIFSYGECHLILNIRLGNFFITEVLLIFLWLISISHKQPLRFYLWPLTISDQCFPSCRNQSIDLENKSIDWFLYDGEHWSLMD